jgi:hypothetical protein
MRPFTTGNDYANQLSLETDEESGASRAPSGELRASRGFAKQIRKNLFHHNQNIKADGVGSSS